MIALKARLLVLIPVGVVLGFLITNQYSAAKQVLALRTSEDNALYALEVESLIGRTQKLRAEVTTLREKKEDLNATRNDRSLSQVELEKEGAALTVIDATTRVKGKGVRIEITQKLEREQIVDVLNALRNMGAEALAINTNRMALTTGIRPLALSAPYIIEVIGDPDILVNGLTRPGGILSQIRAEAEITRVDLSLGAALR